MSRAPDDSEHTRTHASRDPGQGQGAPDRPWGVYVHYPFCSVRCPYCDFAIDTRAEIPHGRYADAVIAEMAHRLPWFAQAPSPGPLRSIYFGGGTPGLWPAEYVGRIIQAVLAGMPDATRPEPGSLEITLEANPGEMSLAHLQSLRAQGINRLSFGVQSFNDKLLKVIGRNHDAQGAVEGIECARAAGFDNLACDLMFALPGQTQSDWENALARMVDLGPSHISCYGLTIEPGTPFGQLAKKGQLAQASDDRQAAFFLHADRFLAARGYEHYEISNYAKQGARARHNSLYWIQGAYLGLGCSAASFRPLADGNAWRFTNPRSTDTYLRAAEKGGGRVAPVMVEKRTPAGLESEALWLALRTVDGVNRAAHRQAFGCDPLNTTERQEACDAMVNRGWLGRDDARIWPTAQGMLLADEIATRLCF